MSTESQNTSESPTLNEPTNLSLSPTFAANILQTHPDADVVMLQRMAQSFVATVRSRDEAYQQEQHRLMGCIQDLEEQVEHYTTTYNTAPESYVANDGRLLHFTIPLSCFGQIQLFGLLHSLEF
jgi:hypothetical protein